MKLTNTLVKETSELQLLEAGRARVYSCGPTLYNRVHIGNLNSFIVADMLNRALKADGNEVNHVMNITDVDDKTIKASLLKYPDINPNEALLKLTQEYAGSFMADMNAVGNTTDKFSFINATDNIKEMQDMITDLFKLGYAYVADDGVYFSIEAYQLSGKKYGQLVEISTDSTSQARIDNDEYDKDSAHDFVLWKKQKAGEPAWDFELDGNSMKGRPGWHIECSAMSQKMLGDEFDVHTGGIDLVFPHHENEIAQSTALKQTSTYASVFMHNEHLLVDGRKMSKSLENFFTLQDIADKGFDPLAFRMLVLQSHYRNQTNFSWEGLQAAQNRLNDCRALAVLRYQPKDLKNAPTIPTQEIVNDIKKYLLDDLDTPNILAYLSGVTQGLQTTLVNHDKLECLVELLEELDALLGLNLMAISDISDDQKKLVSERKLARDQMDWKKSDQLRDELLSQNIAVRDTEFGTIWNWQ